MADLRSPASLRQARFAVGSSEVVRLRENGSYDELEEAVDGLRVHPLLRAAWMAVRVEGQHPEAVAWSSSLRFADAFVDRLMPARVLVPGAVREAWLRSQDGATLRERVRLLSRRGMGVIAIAEAQQTTVWQVRRALGR